MTPYELRFSIFKEAFQFLDNNYHCEIGKINTLTELGLTTLAAGVEYPTRPTIDEVESLAEKINNFVSSK